MVVVIKDLKKKNVILLFIVDWACNIMIIYEFTTEKNFNVEVLDLISSRTELTNLCELSISKMAVDLLPFT